MGQTDRHTDRHTGARLRSEGVLSVSRSSSDSDMKRFQRVKRQKKREKDKEIDLFRDKGGERTGRWFVSYEHRKRLILLVGMASVGKKWKKLKMILNREIHIVRKQNLVKILLSF